MSRILLADDSPHAQRMGERILREEGYDVVSFTDGDTTLKRLADVDPDLIIVDVFLPGKNGFELCRQVKSQERHRHVRVVMTAGMLEVFDEDEARRAGADAIIKKPFEASVVVETIKPLIDRARQERGVSAPPPVEAPPSDIAPVAPEPVVVHVPMPPVVIEPEPEPPPPPPVIVMTPKSAPPPPPAPLPVPAAGVDPELVRAAVTVSLDDAMPLLIDEITDRVLAALRENR